MARETYETIDDLRQGWRSLRERLENTKSHIERMLREYGTLEDEINELEKVLIKAQEEAGISQKQITAPESDEIDKLLEDL